MNVHRDRAGVLIADGQGQPWATDLAGALRPLPVDLHWSRTDVETIDLITATEPHLAVVDGEISGGGIGLLRRVRKMGLGVPCLLVCNDANQRLLQEALELDVYSVVTLRPQWDLLTPIVFKVLRQVYHFDWSGFSDAN